MSRIRGRDTKIELLVRKALHAQGFRYLLGGAGLPGRPDIVLPKYRTVVFVHGCFWHGHDCHLFRLPGTRTEFWKTKIDGNRSRDIRQVAALQGAGWHVEIVWECELRGQSEKRLNEAFTDLGNRIKGNEDPMKYQKTLDLPSLNGVAEDTADGTPLWWKLQALVDNSDKLFVKKLSRNDTSWADDHGKHQAGFYIPRQIRELHFFPDLVADNPDKPHIYHAECRVLWPQTGETTDSHIRHYSNKGPESHFTCLPKALFQQLTPASLLVIGRLRRPIADCHYWIIVLDSGNEEAELLETVLDLQSDFHYGLFDASCFEESSRLEQDEKQALIQRLEHAIRTGSLDAVLKKYGRIPEPGQIAADARNEWLRRHQLESLDPWSISRPGDAIMEISRDIEFTLYRRYELQRRAAELVAVLSDGGDLVSAIVNRFSDIDRIFLSASQQRKNRAGRSFEHHIGASLKAGRIRFAEQAVTGGRRPDFVIPDVATLRNPRRDASEALVMAAKTTLRERWKQVSSERLNCDVFLATVDDRVPETSLGEMAEAGIRLVVPESLKESKEACYRHSSNVLSFREFFDEEVRRARPGLLVIH